MKNRWALHTFPFPLQSKINKKQAQLSKAIRKHKLRNNDVLLTLLRGVFVSGINSY